MRQDYDVLIVGGGVTGAAVGYGLAKAGVRVGILDATPDVDRASRSNMGLVWVQSKGAGFPEFGRWGIRSSREFDTLAPELKDLTGIDIEWDKSGGVVPFTDEKSFNTRAELLKRLEGELGMEYKGRMIDRKELEEKLPKIRFGEKVVGAAWHEEDGYLEPLQMMFAFRKGTTALGGDFISDCRVRSIGKDGEGYRLETTRGPLTASKLVLTAGLGNRMLGRQLGFQVPIRPDRAHDILTERVVDKVMPIPVLGICQTPGGTIMVGYKHEFMGSDLGFKPESAASEGRWAMDIWPDIGKLRVIRCWSCLRVMPNDSFPIYDRVPGHENAFFFNCHSAVTLAAIHAKTLPGFVIDGTVDPDASKFGLDRFTK